MRGTVTVTVKHPQPTDRFGDPSGAAPADDTIEECLVAPRMSSEDNSLQASVFTGLEVYAPPGATVPAAVDRLEIPGQPGRWQVDGDPARWDLSGHTHRAGVEIPVKKVVG